MELLLVNCSLMSLNFMKEKQSPLHGEMHRLTVSASHCTAERLRASLWLRAHWGSWPSRSWLTCDSQCAPLYARLWPGPQPPIPRESCRESDQAWGTDLRRGCR